MVFLLIGFLTSAATTSCTLGPLAGEVRQISKPEVSSFAFTAAGDYGFNSTTSLNLMISSGASFNLALGDLSYSSTLPEYSWCDYVKSHVGTTFPFQLIAGNHEDDYGGDGHISNFAACLPDKIGVTGDYPEQYYFDYQNLARFIMISPDLTIDGQHYYYGDSNEHYHWVENAINGARAAGIPWVIVGMHKPCLSMGPYYCNIYADLMNLLVDKKVDLVLQAHDHTYQRSKQLSISSACPNVLIDSFNNNCVADDGEDDVYTKGLGTVFVIAGTAGADLYDINTSDSEAGYFAKWMGANISPRKGFMKFAVSTTEILAQFVSSTATSDFTDNFAIREPK
jgi:hypothetical protein